MAMPPEHLQLQKADNHNVKEENNDDSKMLGVSQATPPSEPIIARQCCGETTSSVAASTSFHRTHPVSSKPHKYNHHDGHDPMRNNATTTTTAAAVYHRNNHAPKREIISTQKPAAAALGGGFYPTHNNHHHNRATREAVLQRLSEALLRRSLRKIDLSQRGLQASDARLVKMALAQNANLTVLKLGYNNLGDYGIQTLAAGIVAHKSLNLLDLGFNNIGDEGLRALAQCMRNNEESNTLHTLYLAGNLIGEDGAMAMADFLRKGSSLRRLFMTGNRIGGEGVKAITEAILEQQESTRDEGGLVAAQEDHFATDAALPILEDGIDHENDLYRKQTTIQQHASSMEQQAKNNSHFHSNFHGMQELYLGGTGMELVGCHAVARLLEKSLHLRVVSLPNCDIGDEEVRMLALSIKANKDRLPLESLQLSFNNITHHGLEAVANALWGSKTLRELKVDNNSIGDLGAHQIAAVIPAMEAMEVLDVGFNSITASGLTVLMKTVAESKKLRSLSLSGNSIDANAAKSVAYALAYNFSLKSVFLVHCSIGHEDQRHIAAGIVSNSRMALDRLNGFEIGPILLTLGFPDALKNWTNEQVFNFIHLMWDKHDENENFHSDLERDLDPLSFLSGPSNDETDGYSSTRKAGPIEASIVVEVAKRFFESLVANGIDVTSRRPSNSNHPSIGSPLATDAIITESSPENNILLNPTTIYTNGHTSNSSEDMRSSQARSFVAPPESPIRKKQELQDPTRKKRIVEWLCSNTRPLNQMAHVPFSSRELWKLHQFYFTPVVKESGGSSSPQEGEPAHLIISSVPEVHRIKQNGSAFTPPTPSVDFSHHRPTVPMSDPAISGPANTSSSTLLKRKVSYRCLGDATSNTEPQLVHQNGGSIDTISVAKIIEDRHYGHSLPPKTKKARRNRTRISFLPRIKAKLDSCLDMDHEKALVIMRQLYFVERAILSGNVIPIEGDATPRTHLSGVLAAEAEMIIVDMM